MFTFRTEFRQNDAHNTYFIKIIYIRIWGGWRPIKGLGYKVQYSFWRFEKREIRAFHGGLELGGYSGPQTQWPWRTLMIRSNYRLYRMPGNRVLPVHRWDAGSGTRRRLHVILAREPKNGVPQPRWSFPYAKNTIAIVRVRNSNVRDDPARREVLGRREGRTVYLSFSEGDRRPSSMILLRRYPEPQNAKISTDGGILSPRRSSSCGGARRRLSPRFFTPHAART